MKSALSLRLLLLAALTTVLALVATTLVLNILFRLYFEDRARDELETYLLLLSGNLSVSAAGEVTLTPLSDPRFSTALSGYYWQAQVGEEPPMLSSSFWAAPLALSRPEAPGVITYEDVEKGTGEAVAVAHWLVTTGEGETRREIHLAVAIDRADLDASVSQFLANSALWLTIMGAFLMLGSYVQVRIGLSPLERIRSEISQLGRAPDDRLSDQYPTEVQPLISEVNSLLDTTMHNLERARSDAGNLAHGLKTPLTILHGVERKLRRSGDDTLADELHTEVANIEHIVERELARSRASHQARQRCAVRPIAQRLERAFQNRPGAEHITWTIDVPDDVTAPFDAFDFTEILGNLLDNATKWAATRIVISAGEGDGTCHVAVEDDGPGIQRAARAAVLQRGSTSHHDATGAGLGLTIAKDMAASHGCALTLDRATLGGLRAQISWPLV